MVPAVNLMSYNIHFGTDGSGSVSLPHIMETVSAARPDIVCLQEVDKHWSERSGFADQTWLMSRRLGMHAVYGANLDMEPLVAGAPRRQYGTALLSKYPIVYSRNYPLSSFGDEQRGLLEAEIDVGGIVLRVYNVHMGLTARQRLAQAGEALAIIANGEKRGPVVLAGDFNAEPDSPELRLLLEAGLRDSFAGMPAEPTFPSTAPDSRIDYILANDGLIPLRAAVLPSVASDHRPIVSEFVFA